MQWRPSLRSHSVLFRAKNRAIKIPRVFWRELRVVPKSGDTQKMDPRSMDIPSRPSPWTPSWTPSPWTTPCGPPLIIEDEFYWRSKRVLRTLNGRICVDKLYITIIRIKDPSYTLGPIFPELHESMNVIGWVSWSGERVTIFEGGEVGPKRCVTTPKRLQRLERKK